jgi:restriction system protein
MAKSKTSTARDLPTFDQFMNPLLNAMRVLGGSGTVDEINEKCGELARLTDEQLEALHDPARGGRTEFEYRLAWTRTYLKDYGLLENSSMGVWALTKKGRELESVDEVAVKKFVRGQVKTIGDDPLLAELVSEEASDSWKDMAIKAILSLSPAAFERLVQRMLRESGFIQVEVTGRSGDGGIDGKGIMRLGGLMSFHVIFQCKRYRGSVGSDQIRDFRGAMVGRADKGLFVTAGAFTKDAIREATRDGAPAIDLVDGDQLVEKLKELSLGINTTIKQVEEINIDINWFQQV